MRRRRVTRHVSNHLRSIGPNTLNLSTAIWTFKIICNDLLLTIIGQLDPALRFWWTESPLKSPHGSARASRPTQQRALESKCTLLSPQKRAPIFGLAPKRAQEIAQKSKTLKKALKRVGFSNKCSGECVIQKRGALKRVCYS